MPLDAAWVCSALPALGLCPGHTCDAAEAAAVGALPRSVVAILPELEPFRSLPSFRNVFNIPPLFSGLGVLDPLRGCSPAGGTKFEEELFCRLFALGESSPDFVLPR